LISFNFEENRVKAKGLQQRGSWFDEIAFERRLAAVKAEMAAKRAEKMRYELEKDNRER
jgi:hypothetical protein